MRARSWAILLGGTLLLAGALIATWVLWRDLFVWVLIIAPVLILIAGIGLQAAGILSREEPRT